MAGIQLTFSALDLTRTRFAFSPLWEVVMSYRALQRPARFAVHLPWLSAARVELGTLPLSPMGALIRPSGFVPNFLTPPPSTPLPEFADELAVMRASDPDLVRSEVQEAWYGSPLPPAAQVFIDEPGRALRQLSDSLEAYWERLLAPHWPRWRALLEDDVLSRARSLALHGPEAMFNTLGPLIRFSGGVLEVQKELCRGGKPVVSLEDRGLLLIPSAFVWPGVMVILDDPWQPTLSYTPRGVANLWRTAPPPVSEALGTLLGRGRASVLLGVESPATTSDLARLLHLAPSSVSEHLSVLRRSGLVERRPGNGVSGSVGGRGVYYSLSDTGCQLLGLLSDTPN